MTPQLSFMTAAPLQKDRVVEVRELLASMNFEPGVVNPNNSLVPFAEFNELHFARFVVLDDRTLGDASLYGLERADPPLYLAFLGDFDGEYDAFIRHLTARAGHGLRLIFSCCEGFSDQTDLAAWMKANERPPATYYCNWVGRTVLQCREEERLRLALRRRLDQSSQLAARPPREIRADLVEFVNSEQNAGRLTLTPDQKTPSGVLLRRAFDIFAIIVMVVTLPLTIVPLIVLALVLRWYEKKDPEFAPRPDSQSVSQLAAIEDHGVTNQFTAMGSAKPGIFRLFLLTVILWIIGLTTRVIYTKGRLARVHTIHFARWVFLDNKTRLLFASNYDGSLESYMDDFINKVAFGLNAVFSNGIGYPKTRWLVLDGAKNEQLFKYFIRRHELPTEVWYNAHAGLTAFDLDRNSLIRQGVEADGMTEAGIVEWLALL
jgi:hypothetical protein